MSWNTTLGEISFAMLIITPGPSPITIASNMKLRPYDCFSFFPDRFGVIHAILGSRLETNCHSVPVFYFRECEIIS